MAAAGDAGRRERTAAHGTGASGGVRGEDGGGGSEACVGVREGLTGSANRPDGVTGKAEEGTDSGEV